MHPVSQKLGTICLPVCGPKKNCTEIFYRVLFIKKMIDEDHLKLSQIIILQLREETLPWRVTQGNYFYLF